jgi:hypothetical protein
MYTAVKYVKRQYIEPVIIQAMKYQPTLLKLWLEHEKTRDKNGIFEDLEQKDLFLLYSSHLRKFRHLLHLISDKKKRKVFEEMLTDFEERILPTVQKKPTAHIFYFKAKKHERGETF